jgi:hypothetical protein
VCFIACNEENHYEDAELQKKNPDIACRNTLSLFGSLFYAAHQGKSHRQLC